MTKAEISTEQLRQIADNLTQISNEIGKIGAAGQRVLHGVKSINAILDDVVDDARKGLSE
jgi:hypothetical protein